MGRLITWQTKTKCGKHGQTASEKDKELLFVFKVNAQDV